MSFEKFKNRIEMERDEVSNSVRKFVKDRSLELEKEILDMAEKFQETRGFMMELITLDLGHEVCFLRNFIKLSISHFTGARVVIYALKTTVNIVKLLTKETLKIQS